MKDQRIKLNVIHIELFNELPKYTNGVSWDFKQWQVQIIEFYDFCLYHDIMLNIKITIYQHKNVNIMTFKT